MRPKVKFLVAVWGHSYIKRFLSLALPSYLAPGNLPFLAASTELEVVIMTSKDNVALFESDFVFRQVSGLCRIRFIHIDDLIATGCYGVTLTLAYGRAIISLGEDMRSTHFVLMNADFILADGSLGSLVGHISDGKKVIVAPSFRAVAEEVGPTLEAMVDQGKGTLTISPRQLVRLALDHNHPTNIAKTVNQNFCHILNPNQFFWRVDEQTVIGRHFLIFPLCLRPERIISKINSYCDYGFIPEMCPSEDVVVLRDSDDLFMLELAALDQESHLIRMGRQLTVKELSKTLSEWTTHLHRKIARHTLVFHASDIPSSLGVAVSEVNRFMNQLECHLSNPKSHKFHCYWVSGVQYWRELRKRQCQLDDAPEIESEPVTLRNVLLLLRKLLRKLVGFGKLLLLGYPPYVRLCHYAWQDFRLIREQISAMLETAERIFYVSANYDPMGSWLSRINPDVQLQYVSLLELLVSPNKFIPSLDSSEHSNYICYLSRKNLHFGEKIVDLIGPNLSKGGELLMFADGLTEIAQADLFKLVSSITQREFQGCAVSFVGGALKHFIAQSVSYLATAYTRQGLKSLPYVMPALTFLLITSALNNVFLMLVGERRRVITFCSSLLIRVKKARS